MTATQTKSQRTIADYLGDLIALETHIDQALDHQVNLTQDDPTAQPLVLTFQTSARTHLQALEALQTVVGTTAGNPIIAAGATVVGKMAGLVDLVRTEAISKAMRDDYTAFGLAAISYGMFHATATALGDQPAADLAKTHLEDYAAAMKQIDQAIAGIVVSELAKDDHQVAPGSAKITTDAIVDAWRTDRAAA